MKSRKKPPRTSGAKPEGESENVELTRRTFLKSTGAITGGLALGVPMPKIAAAAAQSQPHEAIGSNQVPLELSINGKRHSLTIDPRVTLLDLLRENLDLTGTKKGCDHGQCGACTVLANGRRINSCLSLAVVHQGDEIVTIEGIAQGTELHPVQAAFLEHDGFQCGYCTPGQICSAVALLNEIGRGDASYVTPNVSGKEPIELTAEEIRERMSGNICRCGAYPGIVQAILQASGVEVSRKG